MSGEEIFFIGWLAVVMAFVFVEFVRDVCGGRR